MSCHTVLMKCPTLTSLTLSLTCSTPPISIRAARRASPGLSPAAILASTSSSRYASSSSARSRSTRSRWSRLRRRLSRRGMSGIAKTLSGLEGVRDGHRNPPPVLGLGVELAPPGPREPVVLGAAVVLRLAPGRLQPAGLLHPVQGREEGAGFDLKGPLRDLFDAGRDPQPVQPGERQRPQHQQAQRPLQKVDLLSGHATLL